MSDLTIEDDQSGAIDSLRERFAAVAHESWSGWVLDLFERCIRQDKPPWLLYIPSYMVLRWQELAKMPYSELSEGLKDLDRAEADRYIEAQRKFLEEALAITPDPGGVG